MKRFTITAGTGFDSRGDAIALDVLAAKLAVIRSHLAGKFGGFTETETVGGWLNGVGELVLEHGRRWIVLADDSIDYSGQDAARYVGRMLDQSAVMLETESVPAEFVAAEVAGEVARVTADSFLS